jgi:stearoyl-CoA desaturase (delta-9 desaturase)
MMRFLRSNLVRISVPQHIGALLGLIMLVTGHASPWWLILTMIGWLLIGVLAFSTFYHRYFCHASFKTWRWLELTMAYLGLLAGQGHPIAFVALHNGNHHPHADKKDDLHSPRNGGFWHAYCGWQLNIDPHTVKAVGARRLMKDRALRLFGKHYYGFWWGSVIFMAIINPYLVIFGVLLPGVLHFHIEGFINAACHTPGWGYRNFETPDDSRNIRWFNWLTFGSGLHNNHHARPSAWNWAMRPGEYDPIGRLIPFIASEPPRST